VCLTVCCVCEVGQQQQQQPHPLMSRGHHVTIKGFERLGIAINIVIEWRWVGPSGRTSAPLAVFSGVFTALVSTEANQTPVCVYTTAARLQDAVSAVYSTQYLWISKPTEHRIAGKLHRHVTRRTYTVLICMFVTCYVSHCYSMIDTRYIGPTAGQSGKSLGWVSDSWSRGRQFDSRPFHCRIARVNSAFHPSGVGKSSIGVRAGRVHLYRVAGNTVRGGDVP